MTFVSTIDWKPAPKPEYLSFTGESLTGNTDHGLYLSNLPYIYPKSLVHDIHLNPFVTTSAYLSPDS